MKAQTLVKKYLPQNPDIEVLVPNYKEPTLLVNHGGFGWYGLQAYNEQGQLMCHECGKFYSILAKHLKKHGINKKQYKEKYGLLQCSQLTSEKVHKSMSIALKNRKDWPNFAKGNMELYLMKGGNNNHSKMALELQNRYDSCPQQLLRCLHDLSKVYGPDITVLNVYREKPSLVKLLQRQFGSFNKAKQILKLIANSKCTKIDKHLILEDMVAFYNNYRYWPRISDYKRHIPLCSFSAVARNGGIKTLRQEAMKLREEQEARRIRGEGIGLYANNIEMELAGTARR